MKKKYVQPMAEIYQTSLECVLLASPGDTSNDKLWEDWVYGEGI